uniref:hypothetical protein n=1 Tax=Mycobacterium sp. HUMS_1102779 TaxID=3383487 RepID=UPI003899AD44
MPKELVGMTDEPQRDTREIYKQVAFRAVVGDEPGHGEVYSLPARPRPSRTRTATRRRQTIIAAKKRGAAPDRGATER